MARLYLFWDHVLFHSKFTAQLAQTLAIIHPLRLFLSDTLCAHSLATFCAIQETLGKIFSVVRKYGLQAVLNLLPFVALMCCSIVVGQAFPQVLRSNARSCMILFGGLFVELVTGLMLAHMTEKRLTLVRLIQLPAVAIAAAAWSGILKDGENARLVILLYLSSVLTMLAFKFTVVISEITECLGIWCFDIVTPRVETVAYVSSESNGNGKEYAARENKKKR